MTVRVISSNTGRPNTNTRASQFQGANFRSSQVSFGENSGDITTSAAQSENHQPTSQHAKSRSRIGRAYHAVVLAALTGLGIQSYNASNQLSNTQRELTTTQTRLSASLNEKLAEAKRGLSETIQQLTQQEVRQEVSRQLPSQGPTMALTAINPNTGAVLARVREATFEIKTVSTLFGPTGIGSGVLVMTNEGPMILTNKHVVSDAAENQAKNKTGNSKDGNQCGIIPFDFKAPEGNGLNSLPPLTGPTGPGSGGWLFGSPKLGDLMENFVLPNRTIVMASSYQAPSSPTFNHSNISSNNLSGQTAVTSTETSPPQLMLSPRFISNNTDLALMKIENPTPDMAQKAIPIRDLLADPPVITEAVYAVGQPLGVDFYVSKGIISKEQYRTPGKEDSGIYLGTDTPINPGNSGGPLVDEYGRLIGLNSFIMTKSGASNGVGFTLRLDSIQDELSRNACIELLQPPAKK